jgi:hypothetical protein
LHPLASIILWVVHEKQALRSDKAEMDSFVEWVKTAQYPCIQEWGEKAVQLGASWDSFRRDKPEVVHDLVQGGVPILAARDIVNIVSDTAKRSSSPMAIFWDLENMPIPSQTSGREITSSLKSILAPNGGLVQFRGYASIGLGHIPQEKRLDLQLSGCHLVDCPHNGRKEVADKMIIVDAMQFAFQHPEGATLCFITGDVDYAYLLAVLQRPQWRTIVISRGTMQSMLHVNCDMKIRWETDILQPIYTSAADQDNQGKVDVTEISSTEDGGVSVVKSQHEQFVPLTADEEWKDDVELLRTVVKRESQKFGELAPRKSLIGNVLRATNPARFPHREAVKIFLAQGIENGVVVESGEGAFKTLCLPVKLGLPSAMLPISLSKRIPLPFEEIPTKVIETAQKGVPYIVFICKIFCPPGGSPPPRAFVQSTSDWIIYMFNSYSDASRSVSEYSWLQSGTFVDWRQIVHRSDLAKLALPALQSLMYCRVCGASSLSQARVIKSSCGNSEYCSSECQEWVNQDEDSKQGGVQLTLETLEFLARNDDIYTATNILAKLIYLRHPTECPSRKFARLWIQEAERLEKLVMFKRPETKQKQTCLNRYLDDATFPFPGDHLDTSQEEDFVYNLLWEKTIQGIDRMTINRLLAKNFDTMQKTFMRARVFLNGRAKERSFIAKGTHHQMVALTIERCSPRIGFKRIEGRRRKC